MHDACDRPEHHGDAARGYFRPHGVGRPGILEKMLHFNRPNQRPNHAPLEAVEQMEEGDTHAVFGGYGVHSSTPKPPLKGPKLPPWFSPEVGKTIKSRMKLHSRRGV
jgi:hypothetical protein